MIAIGDRVTTNGSLPLAGATPVPDACSTQDGCITCGDVALPLTAVESGETDALCRDDEGRQELVALELVGPVVAGDRVLVHAGVALERLDHAGNLQHQPPAQPATMGGCEQ